MVTANKISIDGSEVTTYGVAADNGGAYNYRDVSTDKTHAEIIDRILSSAGIPAHLTDRVTYALIGILTEV